VILPRGGPLLQPALSFDQDQRYRGGQAALGLVHLQGRGVERDLRLAEMWLARATAQNEPIAAAELSIGTPVGTAGHSLESVSFAKGLPCPVAEGATATPGIM
jgi:hypothetical protein